MRMLRYRFRQKYPYNDTIYEESVEHTRADSKSSITVSSDKNLTLFFQKHSPVHSTRGNKTLMQTLAQTQIQKALAVKRESVYDEQETRVQSHFKHLLRKQGHIRSGSGTLKSPLPSIPSDGLIRPEQLVSKAARDEYWPREGSETPFKFYSPDCSSQKPTREREMRHCQSTAKEKASTGVISDVGFELFEAGEKESEWRGTPIGPKLTGFGDSTFVFQDVETVDDIVDSGCESQGKRARGKASLRQRLPERAYHEDTDLGLQKHFSGPKKLFRKSSSLREKMRVMQEGPVTPKKNQKSKISAHRVKSSTESKSALRQFRRSRQGRFLVQRLHLATLDTRRCYLGRLRRFNQEYKCSVMGYILDRLRSRKRQVFGNKLLRLLKTISRRSIDRRSVHRLSGSKATRSSGSRLVGRQQARRATQGERVLTESKVSRISAFAQSNWKADTRRLRAQSKGPFDNEIFVQLRTERQMREAADAARDKPASKR